MTHSKAVGLLFNMGLNQHRENLYISSKAIPYQALSCIWLMRDLP